MMETLLGAAMEVASQPVNLERPDRGAYAQSVREAATVPPKLKRWAQCVLSRETGGVLHNKQSREDAREATSSAAGRWQMLAAWESGFPFIVKRRLVQFGMPKKEAQRVKNYLTGRPIHSVDGWFQDIAFLQVVEEGGWRHWYNGGDRCDRLMLGGGR